MKDPWKSRIFGWNNRLKQRGAAFRITKSWLSKFEKCPYCRVLITAENAGLDHKIALCNGGTDHPSNLHITCQLCNRAKSSLSHAQFESLCRILHNPPFNSRARIMVLRKLRAAWRVQ